MGPLYDGAAHFLTSPGDLLCAFALALFAGLRGPLHSRRTLLVLPGAWLLGALAGTAFAAVPGGAVVSALWLLVVGGLLALDAKLAPWGMAALAACAGGYHGFLNGSGLGWSASTLGALLGLAAAVFALVALTSRPRSGTPRGLAANCCAGDGKLDRRQRSALAGLGRATGCRMSPILDPMVRARRHRHAAPFPAAR